jgi:hypothetical protein
MMANITIKTNVPGMALGLSEGANAVELRAVKEELGKLQAREGVRAEAANTRWKRTQRRLARKYSTEPVGRVRGAFLGAWGLLWYGIYAAYDYLSAWNRGA